MEAVIIAGGLGVRLLPLTEHCPKHLLPVAGIPFVVHQLTKLAEADIGRVVLATSYLADQFEPVLGDGSRWGIELVYVREQTPLGTGGAISNAAIHRRSKPAEPVVIFNGDILSGHDLSAQIAQHRDREAEVTLHLVEVEDARAFGCVPTDDAGNVLGFVEKSPNPVSRQINAGCYVFTRSIFDAISPGRVSVERETFPGLLASRRRVMGYLDNRYWLDVGTPDALRQASADVVRGIAVSAAFPGPIGDAWLAEGVLVPTGSAVRGGSAVGPGTRLSTRVDIAGSVIGARSSIGPGCRVVDSVVGSDVVIGSDVILRNGVVGDRAHVGSQCELIGGARVGYDVTLPARSVRFSPG
ncbi:MAG: sugar phosphate nucleotidyltransferase [Nocardioidaceae bacterium]